MQAARRAQSIATWLPIACSLAIAACGHCDTFVLFEDNAEWLLKHQDRGFRGTLTLDSVDAYSGKAAMHVTPAQAFISGWSLPIREKPGKGEYRYLTMALKKPSGEHLVVHFGGRGVIHYTHAGLPVWWPSVELLRDLPSEWRAFEGDEAIDLFDLFGEFDLTYISFAPCDGEWGKFDHVVLTSTMKEARALLDAEALRRSVMPVLAGRIASLEKAAGGLPRHLHVAARAMVELGQAKEELRRASAQLRQTRRTGDASAYAAHRHLTHCRQLLDGRIARRFANWRLASTWPNEANPAYGVGLASTAERVHEDDPFLGASAKTLSLELARNEREGAQLVVVSFEEPLTDVEVETEVSQVSGEALSLEASPVGCIPTGPSRAPVNPAAKRRWPDPLLPGGPVHIPAGEARMWFVTAHAAAECAPGRYQGSVTVRPANAPPYQVPVSIQVWNFALSRETHLKTAFSLTECAVEAFYDLPQGMPQSLRREYYRFCLDHRLNPSNLYGSTDASFSTRHRGAPTAEVPMERIVTPRDEDLEWCVEQGMNLFNITIGCTNWMPKKTFLKRLREFVSRYPSKLRDRELLDRAYIYCYDEPQPKTDEHYAGMREMLALIHERAPELKRAATYPPDPKLHGYIDIWIPLISQYDAKVAQERRAAGDEVWWYVCNVPNHPFPNFAIVEAPFIDGRVLPWLAWEYGVEGLLYHNLNNWFRQIRFNAMDAFFGRGPRRPTPMPESLRWPRAPWVAQKTPGYNGDGMLMYPGPEGRPLSSVRLVNIRDGLEDYEYLWLLRQRVAQRKNAGREVPQQISKLLEIPDEVAKDLRHYTVDPSAMLAHRRRLAEAIVALGE